MRPRTHSPIIRDQLLTYHTWGAIEVKLELIQERSRNQWLIDKRDKLSVRCLFPTIICRELLVGNKVAQVLDARRRFERLPLASGKRLRRWRITSRDVDRHGVRRSRKQKLSRRQHHPNAVGKIFDIDLDILAIRPPHCHVPGISPVGDRKPDLGVGRGGHGRLSIIGNRPRDNPERRRTEHARGRRGCREEREGTSKDAKELLHKRDLRKRAGVLETNQIGAPDSCHQRI